MTASLSRLLLLGAVGLTLTSVAYAEDRIELTTIAEKTNFRTTGRYSEVLDLCNAFEKKYPDLVKQIDVGLSGEGRVIKALVVSGQGHHTPESNSKAGVPVLLWQGGIHAGEIDGKDAGFKLLRELLQDRPAVFNNVTVVFLPVYNVDGHERFGLNTRPNQNGPEEKGFRTTAQNLDLNRDYAKVDSPEAQAMVRLLNQWDPLLYIDLHVTDGADFQYAGGIVVQPRLKGPQELARVGSKISDELMKRMAADSILALPFYPDFERPNEPASGVALYQTTPRYSYGYWSMQNRIGILVEAHSWKDYPTRVEFTRKTLLHLLEMAQASGKKWLEVRRRGDSAAKKLSGEVVLSYKNSEKTKTIDFLGYKYTRETHPISGGVETTYFPAQKETWKIPLFFDLVPKLTVKAPAYGYFVPPAAAKLVQQKLETHGVEFEILANTVDSIEIEGFRATEAKLRPKSYEGRVGMDLSGDWKREKRTLQAGGLIVPISQRRSYLVMQLLEPRAPDSFAAWGMFNAYFERKEYIESYVLKDQATVMLEKDPALRAHFNKLLESDPEFAKSPQRRLDFFYQRHPSFDERWQLYPVYRLLKSVPKVRT